MQSTFGNKMSRIKGLSERRRMPRLGKIRTGIKIKSGKPNQKCKCKVGESCVYCTYPAELPFFRLPREVGRLYGFKSAEEALNRAHEMGCTRKDVLKYIEHHCGILAEELEVMLPLEDETAVFPQALIWWGKQRGAKCRGDMEKALRATEEGQVQIPCPCEQLKSEEPVKRTISADNKQQGWKAGEVWTFANSKGECSQSAHLMMLLYKVSMGGVFQLDTGSYHSIVDVNSGIDYVRALVGRIALVPLVLRRVPRETHAQGSKQTHFTLQLIANVPATALEDLRKDTSRILLQTQATMIEGPREANPIYEEEPEVIEVESSEAQPENLPATEAHQPKSEPSKPGSSKGAGKGKKANTAKSAPEVTQEPLVESHDTLLRTCKTVKDLEKTWKTVVEPTWGKLKGPEQKKLIDLKNGLFADLQAGMGGEPQEEQDSDLVDIENALNGASSVEELESIWADVEPKLQGEDKVRMMVVKDKKKTELKNGT